MPRLRASGDRLLPVHEHSGALLHRLPRRHRHAAAVRRRWISPPGSRPTSDGHWHTFDPRNNMPRIGRVLMARGRDATDVAISNDVRSQHARGLHGLDGRSRGTRRVSACMRLLTVRHVTIYRYSEPVRFGEHRMMFRPRESHDLRLVQHEARHHARAVRACAGSTTSFDNSVADRDLRRARRRSCASTARSRSSTSRPPLPDYALESDAQTYPFQLFGRRTARSRAARWRATIRATSVSRWAAQFLDPAGIDRHDGAARAR